MKIGDIIQSKNGPNLYLVVDKIQPWQLTAEEKGDKFAEKDINFYWKLLTADCQFDYLPIEQSGWMVIQYPPQEAATYEEG